MASVMHLSLVVKYYGGISIFWRKYVVYLINVGIKYIKTK